MNIPKKAYFLLAITAGACWGTHGTFASLMGQYGISDNTISLISPVFYGLFFLVLLFKDDIRKIKIPVKWIPVFILYGMWAALYNYAIIKAYWHLPVGLVHTVVFSSLFGVIFMSRVVFKDPLTKEKIISSLLAVLGIAMLLNIFGGMAWSWVGLFWLFLSWLAWVAMVIQEKYFLEKGFDGNAIMVYSGGFGVLILACLIPPVPAMTELFTAMTVDHGAVLLPLAGYAIITSVGAYYFYLQALKRMEPAYVQLGYIADPLTATILGFIFFGQALLPIQIGGAFLILAVVIWVEWCEIKKARI